MPGRPYSFSAYEQGNFGIELVSGSATDKGHHRSGNEDSYTDAFPLFVVADGMGGHRAGEIASSRVVEEMRQRIPEGALIDAGELAAALYHTARSLAVLGATEGAPGSTMTGVAFSSQDGVPCVRIFNIGDSRVYLLRDGILRQITIDHTEYQELYSLGLLDQEELKKGYRKNVLTKALGAGFGSSTAVDQFTLPAVAGDRYILCSDGLSGEVCDSVIEFAAGKIEDPQDAADQLVTLALHAGGRDNVTVVVVDVLNAWPQWSASEDAAVDSESLAIEDDTLPEESAERIRTYIRSQGLDRP